MFAYNNFMNSEISGDCLGIFCNMSCSIFNVMMCIELCTAY